MAKSLVVGAGLSGLTAALNLAQAGHEVTVLEKFSEVGGLPAVHPAVDATPMDTDKLGAFIGAELKEPMITISKTFHMYMYGKFYNFKAENLTPMYVVERGSRKTALDYYLFTLCQKAGVKFEFNHPIRNQSEMADLPPNTVVATGLFADAFNSLNLPYDMCYGFIGVSKVPPEKNGLIAGWFGKFTDDYAYISCSNNVAFGLFFQHRPVSEDQKDRWLAELEQQEGIVFPKIYPHSGPVPTNLLSRPQLFIGDKILAGTISGSMEPAFLFGVHGALVSGKIAAIAFDDKSRAYDLFNQYNKYYRRVLLSKKLMDASSDSFKRALLTLPMELAVRSAFLGKRALPLMMMGIPGYGQLP